MSAIANLLIGILFPVAGLPLDLVLLPIHMAHGATDHLRVHDQCNGGKDKERLECDLTPKGFTRRFDQE